jgi:hypothetical protein
MVSLLSAEVMELDLAPLRGSIEFLNCTCTSTCKFKTYEYKYSVPEKDASTSWPLGG